MARPYPTRVVDAFAPPQSNRPNPAAVEAAVSWLTRGAPIVMPTETVYGLAAPALDREAVAAIFEIKGRPLDNPLIAHVSGKAQLEMLDAELPPLGAALAELFWPGPLTLVVPTRAKLPWVTAGLDSIAVRQPAHPFALALIDETGPLAAPSANRSGRPSPTRAAHVLADLSGQVPLVIDGGELEHGLESTVVDVRGDTAVLLRPGAITVEQLCQALGRRVDTSTRGEVVRSPGMKYRHYSPRAELWLYPPIANADSPSALRLQDDARSLLRTGRRVAVIARDTPNARDMLRGAHFIALPDAERDVGRMLFAWLRELDDLGVDNILVEGISRVGLGHAVMDRLERAATRISGALVAGTPGLSSRREANP